MIEVSNADRVVFPEVQRTKGDVVAYYDRIAPRALPHLLQRPLSIRRYPKGLAGGGFFQKNVPPHYPESIARFARPRSQAASKKHRDPKNREQAVTLYPVLSQPEHLAYLGNQGAIELHIPTARTSAIDLPDRFIVDLDPPAGALDAVRKAARVVRDALAEHGVRSVPIATGSKGYHVVAPIVPSLPAEQLAITAHKLSTLLAAQHPELLTISYRIALRGERVFLDFLRNNPSASVVAPYSLRASARATVATPLAWDELDACAPDHFAIDDVERLLERPDTLLELARTPADPRPFAAQVDAAFERSGLELEHFDRFRS